MDEFFKLNWRISHPSELEQHTTFLSEEAISDSYVYRNFKEPLTATGDKFDSIFAGRSGTVPGSSQFSIINKRSMLSKQERAHCLRALKCLQGGKTMENMTSLEKFSFEKYKTCQDKISKENQKFMEYIQYEWNKKQRNFVTLHGQLREALIVLWKNKCNQYFTYPQFYKEISLLSLIHEENDASIEYNCIGNLLEIGAMAKLSFPTLKEKCCFQFMQLPKPVPRQDSKLPVSCDRNVIKLLENHKIDAVISSSGLNQIIDNTNPNAQWILPVVIKEIGIKDSSGQTINRKVVFIDKVLGKMNPSYVDLKQYYLKRVTKTNLCQFEGFEYPAKDISVTDGLQESNSKFDDEFLSKHKRQIHHNVSYRLWNIKKSDMSNNLMKNKCRNVEINLLIRTKLDACEKSEENKLFPCNVKPKIECQLEYGATIQSKRELAREWASLFFRPFSSLYRVRLCVNSCELVSVEKCSIQKIVNEAQTHYDFKPNLGLGVLEKVLETLIELEPGNYLIQHLPKHEFFAAILKECPESEENAFNLHQAVEEFNVQPNQKPQWLPVDVNYILPAHEAYEQFPATFGDLDEGTLKKLKRLRKTSNYFLLFLALSLLIKDTTFVCNCTIYTIKNV